MLTGFWHGASWNFVCWGLYFGVLLVLEKFVYGKILNKLPSFVRQLYTFVLVVFSWVLFEMETLGDVGRYLQAMFGGAGFADSRSIYLLRSYFLLFLLCIFASGSWGKKVYSQFSNRWPARAQALLPVSVILLMAVCTAYLVNATYNPFLYFRF